MSGVSIVLSVILMIAVGMWLTHKQWLTPSFTSLIAKLVTHVALPCTTFYQLLSQYERSDLLASLPALAMAYCSVGLLYLLAYPVAALLRLPKARRGLFCALFTFSNTIFIGLPINQALFGDAALPPTLMYYFGNTSLFWLIGVSGIQRDGGAKRSGSLLVALKRILNPPLIAFALCTVLLLFDVPKVQPLMKAASLIGAMVTPLAMFFIGSMLYNMIKQGLRWEKGYGALIFARFVLSPALILGAMMLFGGLPDLWRSAYVVQASMPCQSSCAIVAHSYGADAEYATGSITITTVLSMLTIPLFAALTQILP